jgi:3'-phosphoadenosine 5'-phosphosulfate sulfotransferase (PAPS reductase)/FAD synthetase
MLEVNDLSELLVSAPQSLMIIDMIQVMRNRLSQHERPICSISGGSDSDIMVDLIEHICPKTVTYVFFDTGIETQATKRHLNYLEKKYEIIIERRPAVIPVPLGCKKYGQPFLSKKVSEYIERLQAHSFKWEDRPFDELYAEYPKCKAALRWWCNQWGEGSSFNISRNKLLKEFMIENHPWFHISNKCCLGAKKETAHLCDTEFNADMKITGERRSEGGARATANTSCFTPPGKDHIAAYRPLFFIDDADKAIYEIHYHVLHSDCYIVWGMKRTGCAGCPFGSHFETELTLLKKYEPKLYCAVSNIFKDSYEYTRMYRKFKNDFRENNADPAQQSFFRKEIKEN